MEVSDMKSPKHTTTKLFPFHMWHPYAFSYFFLTFSYPTKVSHMHFHLVTFVLVVYGCTYVYSNTDLLTNVTVYTLVKQPLAIIHMLL